MEGPYRSVLPSSVTGALLRAVSTVRSLKEVSMGECDYGMQSVCVCALCVCGVCVCAVCVCVFERVCMWCGVCV